jgi:hypothetical protein
MEKSQHKVERPIGSVDEIYDQLDKVIISLLAADLLRDRVVIGSPGMRIPDRLLAEARKVTDQYLSDLAREV